MQQTLNFLEAVLPSEGWYCAFVSDIKRNVFFKTKQELAEFMLAEDAKGRTVYHACSSYENPSNRTQANVLYVRSLWLDVDAGPGKPYADAESAWRSVEGFRRAIELPDPLYVASGYGLHVYWPLQKELTRIEWEPYARELKKRCADHGLQADPSRTSDSASVLRSPGTHNWKRHGAVVGSNEEFRQHDLRLFGRGGSPLKGNSPRREERASPLTEALANVTAPQQPSDPDRVADACGQLRAMRDSLGVIPEPDWKACINVLAFCDRGKVAAHDWSVGDARYDPVEVEDKFQRGRLLSGPTTCAYFSTLNNICKSCTHQGHVITPVELGRGVVKETTRPVELAPEEVDVLRPLGAFEYRSGSLVFLTETNQGLPLATKITSYPVYVAGVNRGEVKSDSFSVAIKHKPPHEGWQTIEIPLKTLFSSSGLSEVIGRGITVHEGDLFRKFIRESLDRLNAEGKADVQYEQFGWKEDETAFLWGRQLYTPTRVREVAGSSEVYQRSKGLGPSPKGSLELWKADIDQLFAVGCEPQGFAVLASFAAPLMRFQAHDEGGAIISITSRESAQGKSTALVAAASVWGQPDALKLVNIDTKVSKGITLGVLGNLPVFFDELSDRDPESLNEFVQIYTNGRDKMRGTSDGQLIHAAASWQNLMISGNNKSLVDTIRAAKGSDAMTTRIIEFGISMPKTLKHHKGDEIKDRLPKNAGHAGDAYLRALVQPETLAYVKASLPTVREQIIKRHGFNAEHRFWARALAGVAVAGVIVKHLGLVSFSPDRIMEWATDKLTNYRAAESEQQVTGTHLLGSFLNDHLADMLIMPGAWKPGGRRMMPIKLPTRALLVRYEQAEGRLLVDEKRLRFFMNDEGLAWRDFLVELKDAGLILNPRKLVTLGAGTDFATVQTPCVEINALHPLISSVLADVRTFQAAG